MKANIPKDVEQQWKERKRKDELKSNIFIGVIIALGVIIIGGFIAFQIWLRIKYANCTINEIPAWALWWTFNRR